LQAQLLAQLFLVATQGESVADLARRLEAHPTTVQREVDRLEVAGLLTSSRVGNVRLVRADPNSPIHRELRDLLAKTFGPAPLLEAELARVEGVQAAYIFGSWARRFHGEAGALPHDVDLMVIGRADPDEVYRAAQAVEQRLGLEINPIVVGEADWDHPLGLLARVKQEPVVELAVRDADDR
jgi:predicted nucleotidyltransferase